jgi:uncharacterized membrane protein (DUF485 family)
MSIETPDAGTNQGPVDYVAVERSAPFVELKRRHRRFIWPLAVVFLVWYFTYVLLADYAHEFMATRVTGNITVGLLFGLGQFVTTFVITMAYVAFANRNLDPLADDIRRDLEGGRR